MGTLALIQAHNDLSHTEYKGGGSPSCQDGFILLFDICPLAKHNMMTSEHSLALGGKKPKSKVKIDQFIHI